MGKHSGTPMPDEKFAANMDSLLRGYQKRAQSDPAACRFAVTIARNLNDSMCIGVANALASGEWGMREYARQAGVDKSAVQRWQKRGEELIAAGTVDFALATRMREERKALIEAIEADKQEAV